MSVRPTCVLFRTFVVVVLVLVKSQRVGLWGCAVDYWVVVGGLVGVVPNAKLDATVLSSSLFDWCCSARATPDSGDCVGDQVGLGGRFDYVRIATAPGVLLLCSTAIISIILVCCISYQK